MTDPTFGIPPMPSPPAKQPVYGIPPITARPPRDPLYGINPPPITRPGRPPMYGINPPPMSRPTRPPILDQHQRALQLYFGVPFDQIRARYGQAAVSPGGYRQFGLSDALYQLLSGYAGR